MVGEILFGQLQSFGQPYIYDCRGITMRPELFFSMTGSPELENTLSPFVLIQRSFAIIVG